MRASLETAIQEKAGAIEDFGPCTVDTERFLNQIGDGSLYLQGLGNSMDDTPI